MKAKYRRAGVKFRKRRRETTVLLDVWRFCQMTLRVEFEITARAVQRHKKLPGRSRFKVMYKGEEAAKPLRKTMKKLAQIAHYEKYSDRLGKENWKVRPENWKVRRN
jgi:hypothetical protein